MIFKAKGKSQSDSAEYDQTDIYEQFRPAWFHFTSGAPEQQRAANAFHDRRSEEVVVDILHPSKEKTSESSRRFYTASPKPTLKPLSHTRNQSFLALCKRLWIDEELFFAMSKLSLLGLVIGLMFLGAIFFLSGFLMAVNLYGIGAPKIETQLAAQSLNPQHMPTPGYTQGQAMTHSPAGFQANKDINAPAHPHYPSVGGVVMLPSQRLPSNFRHQQRYNVPVPSVLPTRGIIAGVPQQQARPYYPAPVQPQVQPMIQPTTYPAPPQGGAPVYAYPPAGVAPILYPGAPTVSMPAAPPPTIPAAPQMPAPPTVAMPVIAAPTLPQVPH